MNGITWFESGICSTVASEWLARSNNIANAEQSKIFCSIFSYSCSLELYWLSASRNEYFAKWLLHWLSTSLKEYFTEGVLHWMSILHWMSTSSHVSSEALNMQHAILWNEKLSSHPSLASCEVFQELHILLVFWLIMLIPIFTD